LYLNEISLYFVKNWKLRATSGEGPRPRVQWNKSILQLDKSHKLDTHPLDEDPRPRSGKLRLNLNGTSLEEN
jgi:hypothetical protein